MGKKIYRLVTLVMTTVVLCLVATPAFADIPQPKPALPDGIQGKLNTLLGMGMAVVIVACVAGVFLCAGKLALALRHGEGAEAAGKLAAVAFACILVGSGAGIVNYLV